MHFSLLIVFYSGFLEVVLKLTFAAVLQHFAQAGKRQKADDFEFQRGFIVLFARARRKSTIKPQRKDTFGGGASPRGQASRQKQWFYASTAAKPQREAEFL